MNYKKEGKLENNYECLKLEIREFLEELKALLRSKVDIYHVVKGKRRILIDVLPFDFKYVFENEEILVPHDKWTEKDYISFRKSFILDDGFAV